MTPEERKEGEQSHSRRYKPGKLVFWTSMRIKTGSQFPKKDFSLFVAHLSSQTFSGAPIQSLLTLVTHSSSDRSRRFTVRDNHIQIWLCLIQIFVRGPKTIKMSCLHSDSYQKCFSKWGFPHVLEDLCERSFAFSYRKLALATFIWQFFPQATLSD